MSFPSLNYFYPFQSIIQSISNSFPVVIVTTEPHGLLSGNIVRITTMPSGTMPEINNQEGLATVIDPVTFTMPIDSTNYGTFVFSPDYLYPGQVIPIAEVNSTLQNAEVNIGPNNPGG
jgi:hypothetical protein